MGAKRIFRGHGKRRRLVEVTDTLVYVPLLKTTEMLLKDEGIYTEVFYLRNNNFYSTYSNSHLRLKAVINVPYQEICLIIVTEQLF